MNKIKIGVIGVGHLGNFHSKILHESKKFFLVGLYDSDETRRLEKAKEYETTAFNTYDELLANVDAVSIVSPTTFHYDHIKSALTAGKHVFVEKPITSDLSQAEEVVRLSEEKKLIFQVGHIERFNAAMLAIKDIKLNPIFIESHRLSSFQARGTDVAVVLDLMIHDIDLILNLVDSPVKHIDAAGVGIISNTEDISNCRITFENGCVANVTASRISINKMRKMRIFQPGAYIGLDFNKGVADIYYLAENFKYENLIAADSFSLGDLELGNVKKQLKMAHLEKTNINPLKEELEHFAECIQEGKKPLVSGQDGLQALKVAKEILAKIKEHQDFALKHLNLS